MAQRAGDVPALAELARDGGLEERCLAVEALGGVRGADAAAALGYVLAHDEDEAVQAAAVHALGRTGALDAATALRHALGCGSSERIVAVAEALGLVGDATDVDALRELTGFDSAPVRAAAARALGRIGDPRAVDALTALLADPDFLVRTDAEDALVSLGSETGVAALRSHPDPIPVLWRLDARRGRAAMRNAGRRDAGAPRVARLHTRIVWTIVRLLTVATGVLAGGVALGTGWLVPAVTVVVAGTALTWAVRASRRAKPYARVDEVHARLEAWPPHAAEARAWRTAAKSLAPFPPVVTLLLPLALLGLDAVLGATGIGAGLGAALLVAATVNAAIVDASLRRYEREHRVEVWTEALPNPLPRRRYFGRPRR